MNRLLATVAATMVLVAADSVTNRPDAMPFGDPSGIRAGIDDVGNIDKVQYYWGGRRYCWYEGWNGPGWYWCGYGARVGYGWGGPIGWRGWRYGAYRGYRGYRGAGVYRGYGHVGRVGVGRVGAGRVGARGFSGGRAGRRSDIALKHDITLLGHLDNGLGFYRFSYNGSEQAYVGVLAQEVQTMMPEAVVRGRDGYLRVYYDKVGVPFETYDKWVASGAQVPAGAPVRR